MNKVQIDNLKALIDFKYPHICLNHHDFTQFLNIPWEKKNFYPAFGRGRWFDKKGFFHNGNTTIWATHNQELNHIKIADRETPKDLHNAANWSRPFSFEKENSANVINRMMKLKVFW